MALPNDRYAAARDEFLGTVVEDLHRHSLVSIRLPGWSGPAPKTNGRPDFSCGHQTLSRTRAWSGRCQSAHHQTALIESMCMTDSNSGEWNARQADFSVRSELRTLVNAIAIRPPLRPASQTTSPACGRRRMRGAGRSAAFQEKRRPAPGLPSFVSSITPHPPSLRSGTFSPQGEKGEISIGASVSLPRRRLAAKEKRSGRRGGLSLFIAPEHPFWQSRSVLRRRA